MRVAVTGASGKLGTALRHRLTQPGSGIEEVRGISRRIPDSSVLGRHGDIQVTWQPVDIGSPESTERLVPAFTGCDTVVHLAWRLQPRHDRQELRRVNVTGTRNVIGAAVAAGVKHLVVITSVGSYAPGPKNRRWGRRGP